MTGVQFPAGAIHTLTGFFKVDCYLLGQFCRLLCQVTWVVTLLFFFAKKHGMIANVNVYVNVNFHVMFLPAAVTSVNKCRTYPLKHTRVYPKVSGLAAWIENCEWYSSLPIGAVISLFCESV
jgi:hypothetical protein